MTCKPPSQDTHSIDVDSVALLDHSVSICEQLGSGCVQFVFETCIPELELHHFAEWIMHNLPIGNLSSAVQIAIYTDGSLPKIINTEASSAWAFTTCGLGGDGGSYRIGHTMQQLVNSCILANLMLAVSSTMPELVAILYAVIWISAAKPTAPVTIFSDSMVAIDHACQKTAPTFCIRIVQYAVTLLQRLAHCGITVDIQHVYAHIGQPWNEMADSMAKAASKTTHISALPQNIVEHSYDNNISWSAIALGYDVCDSYPPVVDKCFQYNSNNNNDDVAASIGGSVSRSNNNKY